MACEGACAMRTRPGKSRRMRSASCRSRPTSRSLGRVVASLAGIVLHLPLVGTGDVEQVAHLVQPGEDARANPRFQVFRGLAVGAELPAGGARPRIVGGEQRGAAGVVADADHLVEDALLELAVLAALADLVDGEDVHLAQRLQPFSRGEAAGEAVADVGEEQEELLVPAAHALPRRQLAQHGGEQVRLSRAGRPAEEQGALPPRPRDELVHVPSRAQQGALLRGAVGPPARERPIEELGRQPQPGEQREPPRVGAAAAAAKHLVAALVARVEPSLAVARGTIRRAGAGDGHAAALALLEGEPLAVTSGARGLRRWQRLGHLPGSPREGTRGEAGRGARWPRRAASAAGCAGSCGGTSPPAVAPASRAAPRRPAAMPTGAARAAIPSARAPPPSISRRPRDERGDPRPRRPGIARWRAPPGPR